MTFSLRFRQRHPAQILSLAFAAAVVVFTTLLRLPVASEPGQSATLLEALFTATSAVCVTGLTVVDTPSHWSLFGEVTILAAIQSGGFGIMTLASLLGLLISRKMGLQSRLTAAAETKSLGLGDVRRVLRNVAIGMFVVESLLAVVLTLRLWTHYDHSIRDALYSGVFHAISAVCNAGFSLYSDNLMGFVRDPFICLPIAFGLIIGGIGFPVLFDILQRWRRPRTWSVHTKITLLGTLILIFSGTIMMTAFEWRNPQTFGPLSSAHTLLAGFFQAISPRTAGFNSVNYGAMNESTLFGTDILMFIGGGSAGTAGGIKVTTFMLLFFAIVAEARGDNHVNAFGRRIADQTIRLALSVALLGIAVVAGATMFLLAVTDYPLGPVLFEATSAFATVGLTTGITANLPPSAQYLLVALMFLGRTGTVTLATALAIRSRRQLYKNPEERPIVG